MRNYLAILLAILCTLCLFTSDAQAGRFGGGRSFGMQRSVSHFSRPQNMMAGRASATNPWVNRAIGLAAGGLLAYMLMNHGFASGILTWLLLGGCVLLIINLFRNKQQMAPQQNGRRAPWAQDSLSQFMSHNQNTQPAYANSIYAPHFDSVDFLRDAKVQFIRLQAAYDNKNLTDLREFTTPEVFAEIQLQFQERGDTPNHTEVVSLNAELVDSTTESQSMIASVRFSGSIREDNHKAPATMTEIWHFKKESDQSRWRVAGIQQHA